MGFCWHRRSLITHIQIHKREMEGFSPLTWKSWWFWPAVLEWEIQANDGILHAQTLFLYRTFIALLYVQFSLGSVIFVKLLHRILLMQEGILDLFIGNASLIICLWSWKIFLDLCSISYLVLSVLLSAYKGNLGLYLTHFFYYLSLIDWPSFADWYFSSILHSKYRQQTVDTNEQTTKSCYNFFIFSFLILLLW